MTPEDIQEMRRKIGVTQERFAALLGTTVVTVNRWEKGKNIPSRLYVKEIMELKKNSGSYIRRRKELEKS